MTDTINLNQIANERNVTYKSINAYAHDLVKCFGGTTSREGNGFLTATFPLSKKQQIVDWLEDKPLEALRSRRTTKSAKVDVKALFDEMANFEAPPAFQLDPNLNIRDAKYLEVIADYVDADTTVGSIIDMDYIIRIADHRVSPLVAKILSSKNSRLRKRMRQILLSRPNFIDAGCHGQIYKVS